MSKKRFIWRGPPTSIEIWNGAEGKPEWSGFADPGAELPVELDEGSEQVINWLAFGLIEAVPAAAPAAATEKPRNRRDAAQEENTANG